MILFEKDWDKYPSAIPDYQTSNQSWIRLSGMYKHMGINNYKFLLALHNPNLQGVDPHDPNLSEETKLAISAEIAVNPWYYLREVVRLPPLSGPDTVPLKANRANVSMFWLFFNHVTSMLIQPRQTGKSVSTDSLMTWLLVGGVINTQVKLITKDDSLRVKNVKRVKDILSNLPSYVDLRTRKDANNTERITMDALGNSYTTGVAQASKKAALNLGRGETVAINHIDEIAFINNIQITLPALLAATGAARDGAKANNAPYGNIFTTTPGYLSSESGRFAHGLYKEGFKWTEKLFDRKNEDDLVEFIKKNMSGKSKRVIVILEFNHRQLGYTDTWLVEKVNDAMSEGDDANADFFNIWPDGNATSPIKKELLKIIQQSKIPEPYIDISKQGYILRWYINKTKRDAVLHRNIICALDTSDAIGKDDMGLVIRDAETAEVLATGLFNETNISLFSEWLLDLLIKYPKMTMIIERKSSGISIQDYLIRLLPIKGEDPFKRIFNWVANDYNLNTKYKSEVIEVPLHRRSSVVYDKYKGLFGYNTSGSGKQSRDVIYGTVFNQSIKYTGDTVRDKDLIDQISGLTIRNNRIDHKSGSHDDLVFAWLLGYWFLLEAKNKKWYGINPTTVLSSVTDAMIKEEGGMEVIIKKKKQIALKKRLDDLLIQLKVTHNPLQSQILTNKIRHIYKDIDTSYFTGLNIESIIENIMLEKKRNKTINNHNWNHYRKIA